MMSNEEMIPYLIWAFFMLTIAIYNIYRLGKKENTNYRL